MPIQKNKKNTKKGGSKKNNKKYKKYKKYGGKRVIKAPILITINEKNSPDFTFIGEFSPLSGYEPKYEPKKWNNELIRKNHNCYSYMMNAISRTRKNKPQPGYFSGFPIVKDNEYNCNTYFERIQKDNPSIYKVGFDTKCKKGYYKAFMAIADGDDPDYHFYRQDKSGYWSHKPGRREATDLDASGNKIKNPLIADRNYTHYNYKVACPLFCVNPDLGRAYSSRLDE